MYVIEYYLRFSTKSETNHFFPILFYLNLSSLDKIAISQTWLTFYEKNVTKHKTN